MWMWMIFFVFSEDIDAENEENEESKYIQVQVKVLVQYTITWISDTSVDQLIYDSEAQTLNWIIDEYPWSVKYELN